MKSHSTTKPESWDTRTFLVFKMDPKFPVWMNRDHYNFLINILIAWISWRYPCNASRTNAFRSDQYQLVWRWIPDTYMRFAWYCNLVPQDGLPTHTHLKRCFCHCSAEAWDHRAVCLLVLLLIRYVAMIMTTWLVEHPYELVQDDISVEVHQWGMLHASCPGNASATAKYPCLPWMIQLAHVGRQLDCRVSAWAHLSTATLAGLLPSNNEICHKFPEHSHRHLLVQNHM